ncbi:hypothetical protein KFK09_019632 [Dendrobium nobile]|uniref:DUF4283 domain-containing protein n=1 Tax=Dendrobium nobile TaxID=94219 RepID=A0A8T3ARJ1_DENNO|nr:hypothetical protein KFK09_019632 [Dendrobium nobile]
MSVPTSSTQGVGPPLTGKTRSFKDVVSGPSSLLLLKCSLCIRLSKVVWLCFLRRVWFSSWLRLSLSRWLGCQMRLLKWSPNFDVREESPIAPVWLAFPNLRLHFFNTQILFGLASVFGRPLQTDQATASLSRPSVARILVELDVTKKHPQEIWMHGHGINDCFRLHPHLRKEKIAIKPNEVKNNGVSSVLPVIDTNAQVLGEELVDGNGVELVNLPPNLPDTNIVVPDPSAKEGSVAHLPQIVEAGSLDNIEQGKWDKAEIVKSSDELVVVLNEGVVVSSNTLEIFNKTATNTNDVFDNALVTSSSPLVIPINSNAACPQNKVTGKKQVNNSTKEDGVLFLEDESLASTPLDGEMNNDFPLSDHFNSDAFTDTEIEITAKCYARMDNDLSFSKSRGKRGKPRNVARHSPRNTRSHTTH